MDAVNKLRGIKKELGMGIINFSQLVKYDDIENLEEILYGDDDTDTREVLQMLEAAVSNIIETKRELEEEINSIEVSQLKRREHLERLNNINLDI
ncbi:hypothetical protein [Staphylococcus cohnii]|uniref:hypothetical protein n=1 Tax=Staphylococcus cohnii TaxID=29382 RepID=UPI003CF7DEC2